MWGWYLLVLCYTHIMFICSWTPSLVLVLSIYILLIYHCFSHHIGVACEVIISTQKCYVNIMGGAEIISFLANQIMQDTFAMGPDL